MSVSNIGVVRLHCTRQFKCMHVIGNPTYDRGASKEPCRAEAYGLQASALRAAALLLSFLQPHYLRANGIFDIVF